MACKLLIRSGGNIFAVGVTGFWGARVAGRGTRNGDREAGGLAGWGGEWGVRSSGEAGALVGTGCLGAVDTWLTSRASAWS